MTPFSRRSLLRSVIALSMALACAIASAEPKPVRERKLTPQPVEIDDNAFRQPRVLLKGDRKVRSALFGTAAGLIGAGIDKAITSGELSAKQRKFEKAYGENIQAAEAIDTDALVERCAALLESVLASNELLAGADDPKNPIRLKIRQFGFIVSQDNGDETTQLAAEVKLSFSIRGSKGEKLKTKEVFGYSKNNYTLAELADDPSLANKALAEAVDAARNALAEAILR